MLRVTLLEDFGGVARMTFGYEVRVPMSFGVAPDPSQMVNFSVKSEPLPAEQATWWLDYTNDEMRSTLMPDEVATYYFGNRLSSSGDNPLVQAKRIPNLNDERLRVAQVWGDYYFSDKHGLYATVRIAVPKVPKVSISPVNQNGMVPVGAWEYKPHEFWRFEDLLDGNHEAEYAEAMSRKRPQFAAAPPSVVSIADMTDSQIDELVARLSERNKKKAG